MDWIYEKPIPVFLPVSRNTIERAKKADPKQRCIVENHSLTQMVHVYDRSTTSPRDVLDYLEWAWNMQLGTLNLDTRKNILFMSPYLHELYRDKNWALLPSKEMVFDYIEEDWLECPYGRSDFPTIEGDLFQYKFLPVHDMDDIYITRQNSDNIKDVQVHHHPFDTLPLISTHVHPKFVILNLGDILWNHSSEPWVKRLKQEYPYLEQLQRVFHRWIGSKNLDATEDRSYIPRNIRRRGGDDDYEDEDEEPSFYLDITMFHPVPLSDSDSECTVPRRIGHVGQKSYDQMLEEAMIPGIIKALPQKVVQNSKGLTEENLKRLAKIEISGEVEWTAEKTVLWAKDVSNCLR